MPRPSSEPGAWIGTWCDVTVDRPMGSRHPKYPKMIYPINYGFVPGTLAGDGEAIDAYILGIEDPLARFEGPCIAILHRANDSEDKLVAAPADQVFSDDTIAQAVAFQEQYFQTEIVRL